MKSYDTEQGRV